MTAETAIAIAQMGILCVALWTIWTASRAKPFDEIKKSIDELTKSVSHLEAHVSEIKGYIRGREEKN